MNHGRFTLLSQFLTQCYRWSDGKLYSIRSGRYLDCRISSSRRHPYYTLACRDIYPRPIKYPEHEIVGYYKFGDKLVGMTIDHIDNNPTNNDPDNLQLMSLSDNARKEGNSYIRLNQDQVTQIRELLNSGKFTQEEIARKFGVQRSLISKIKLGNRWKGVVI